jgi:pilus assembly protein CpaE
MQANLKALVALDTGVRQELVQQSLPVAGEIEIAGIVEGLEEAWTTLHETDVDLVLVACTGYSERALLFIEGAAREAPSRPVVAMCEGSPNGFVRRAFEMGADDLLRLPELPEEVGFALQKAVARKEGGASLAGSGGSAPLICVLGPKGGTGKTLVAANLGVALARSGRRVAAIDLDLQFGDLGLSLGLEPQRTIFDLAKSAGSIDSDKIEAYLVPHESGLGVLLAPSRPDQAAAVHVEFLREVYAALRMTYDFVIVDTPPGFTPEVIATIDSSTDLVVVGMLDSLSLKNTKLGLETLELMGYDPARIHIVLNRADSRVGITPEDVVAVLGRHPDVFVPSDREVPRALNEAVPIVMAKPGSGVAKAFGRLSDGFSARAAAAANGAGKSDEATRAPARRLLGRRA